MFLRVPHVINAIPTAMNRILSALIFFILFSFGLRAQNGQVEVSYITTQHVYLKLGGLEQRPDSVQINKVWLKVVATSSQSIVLENKGLQLSKGVMVDFAFPQREPEHIAKEPLKDAIANEQVEVEVAVEDVLKPASIKGKHALRGRFTTDYFGSFSPDQSVHRFAQRMNVYASQEKGAHGYSFSTRGIAREYINGSGTPLRWNLYEMNARYKHALGEVLLGRSVPRFAASFGAIDGVAVTVHMPVNIHVLAGYRPDFQTFGLDLGSGMQGVFLSMPAPKGSMNFKSSLGWANMMGTDASGNKGIDRQIIYQQMSMQLLKNVTWYSSLELDTYSPALSGTSLKATGIYASLNYKLSKAGNLYLSYDSRGPRVFYQQFDAALEQALFDMGIQQGYRVRYSHRFGARTFVGVNGTIRSQSTSTTPFSMMGVSLRYRIPSVTNAHISAQFSTSKNASYGTRIGQIQYRTVLGKQGYYRAYARYLGYRYAGSVPAQSDRVYLGGELAKSIKGLEFFTRTELSFRAQQVYPGVQAGLTYRFNTKKK